MYNAFQYSGANTVNYWKVLKSMETWARNGSRKLCEKCPNTKFFLVRTFSIRTEYGDLLSKYLYSVRIWENTDQKKTTYWTLFKQWNPMLP